MDRIGSKCLLLTQRVDAIDKIVKHHGDNVQVLEKLHKLCLALDQDGMKVFRPAIRLATASLPLSASSDGRCSSGGKVSNCVF